MERPSISTDSLGQPHVVCDAGCNTRFMKFHKVNGVWNGGIFAVGSLTGRYQASRLYVGQIEIDSRDRAWISCKFGIKEFGSMYGQGVWLFKNVATNPDPVEQFFRFVCVYKGMGVVTTDVKYPDEGVVMGTFGNWEKVSASGQSLGRGSINAGHGGEKVRARIASYAPRFDAKPGAYPDGIWHTTMCGSRGLTASYQNSARYKAGQGPIPWAAYNVYSIMGNDFHHPGLSIDLTDPRIAYMSSVFYNKMCINIWDGAKMIFDPADLKVLDYGASFEQRHGPSITPSPAGGAFFFWTSNGRIKTAYVSKKGVVGNTLDITAGRSPAAATDRFGNLHLAYFNGGIKYRKIIVSSLDPIAPKGRVYATRTPEFQWSGTDASSYTLALSMDGLPVAEVTVPTNRWTPDDALVAGAYTWTIKEGEADSTEPESSALAFTIPPDMPTPLAPDARAADKTEPIFQWACDDNGATSFRLQLFKGETSLGYLAVAGDGKARTASWPTPLEAGTYKWRLRSQHLHAGSPASSVSSDWTPTLAFQIAVPGPCAITTPDSLASFTPGTQTVDCAWTPAEGAVSYTLTVLYNGTLMATVDSITDTHYPLTRKWTPGYYTLLVQPVNADGAGPMSPARTFMVNRTMSPGGDAALSLPMVPFFWTYSTKANRYLVKLSRYDQTTRRYAVVLENWVTQGKAPSIKWKPACLFTSGSYRWTVTDYIGELPGFTSTAFFQVQN
jgi:hypothetical protein